jgi:hypothetical protein
LGNDSDLLASFADLFLLFCLGFCSGFVGYKVGLGFIEILCFAAMVSMWAISALAS